MFLVIFSSSFLEEYYRYSGSWPCIKRKSLAVFCSRMKPIFVNEPFFEVLSNLDSLFGLPFLQL